jgi:hypothetical protein
MSYSRCRALADRTQSLGFLQWTFRRPTAGFFPATPSPREETTMNTETATNPFPTSAEQQGLGNNGLNGGADRVHKVAQTLHETVNALEEKLAMSNEKLMGLHDEYGTMAREQVRANPLAAVGVAFAAGFVLAKILR